MSRKKHQECAECLTEIRSQFQFWFSQYDSGNPIVLSTLRLREVLAAAMARLDPEGPTRPRAGWC